jgi:CubicO group peptidase (beta-lactamase class C family)
MSLPRSLAGRPSLRGAEWSLASGTNRSKRAGLFLLLTAFAGSCASQGLLGPPPAAQPVDVGRLGDGQLNDQLELIRGNHRLPALAAVMFGPDGVLESGFVGVRALGHPDLIGADDQWHIGSLTKSMTATVAAILIEQGQIGWKTTIAEVLPGIPMRPEYRSVTLTDLLTNSAGMATDATRAPSWGSLASSNLSLSDQRQLLAREYLAMAPVSSVGTFNYSNAGYIVAGTMLEKVTGKAWESLITDDLFGPLQMTSAGFGPPSGSTQLAEPWGHSILDDGFDPAAPGPAADNPPALGPAGTVHASMADLAKYYEIHLKGAMAASSLISQASYQILHTPAPGTIYACGWGVVARDWAGGTAYQHDGSNNFWYSDVWLAPSKGFGVLTLINGAGLRASTAVNDTAVMLITRFNGVPPT